MVHPEQEILRPVSLFVELHATVLDSWRDYDGYGNTDSDCWTMNLRVQSWPSNSTLKARINSDDALDSNALYSIKGRMYINPGQEWTDTYVMIDLAQKFQGPGTIRSDKQPTFEVVARIRSIHDTYISIVWSAWDEYQSARYNQTARATLTRRIPRSHTFINLLARITGTMNGPDHKRQWQCTCIEPEVSAPPLQSEYVGSTVAQGLTTMHAMTQMS